MPSATLDDKDIIKALNYLTDDRFEINIIVSKSILPNGKLKIHWTYKKL